jgi:hypothetical protein
MYDEKGKNLKIIDFGSGVKFENSEIKPRKRVGTVGLLLFSPIISLPRYWFVITIKNVIFGHLESYSISYWSGNPLTLGRMTIR